MPGTLLIREVGSRIFVMKIPDKQLCGEASRLPLVRVVQLDSKVICILGLDARAIPPLRVTRESAGRYKSRRTGQLRQA